MKEIIGYENYCITQDAKVFSKKAGLFLKQSKSKSGYLMVTLKAKGKKAKTITIHRLVALYFIPNVENKIEVNHINGIKTDNSIGNLEWCTREENLKHGHETGLFKNLRRERDMNAKAIYQEETGLTFKSMRVASKHFKVSEQYISQCVRNQCNNRLNLKLVKVG